MKFSAQYTPLEISVKSKEKISEQKHKFPYLLSSWSLHRDQVNLEATPPLFKAGFMILGLHMETKKSSLSKSGNSIPPENIV